MRSRRTHPRAAWVAAVVLPVLTPGALALATGEQDPATTAPPTTPPVLVTEHTATARHIVPFGIAGGAEGQRTIWAFGRTRGASRLRGTTPVPPSPTTPTDAVLLEGTAASPGSPMAWRRAPAPLDVTGAPMASGTWRVEDGTSAPVPGTTPPASAVMHSGQATPKGAAALLVRYAPQAAAARTTILVRTTDRRFRELPSPPAELVAPATDAFAGAASQPAPFAVADATPDSTPAAPASTPATPAPSTPAPDRGRTAVFLAPAGGDGVLRWDGVRWTEEPWVDEAGAPTGPRTPLSLAATPAGEVVALFAGDATAATGARIRLAQRNAKAARFAPVALTGTTPLLDGALPSGVRAIQPAPRPGTALSVAPKHWWIDLLVTRTDDTRVSATVHVRPPGVREPGTTPDPTTPAPTGTAPSPAPAETTPATGASPAPTGATPEPTTPSTPTTPEPTTPGSAEATGTWCTPSLPGAAACDHDLGFRFATARGWTSAAFDGAGRFGERAISSPVLPTNAGTTPPDATATTVREGSASGGFLQLAGTSFALRSGVGDDGTNDTQAARFAAGGYAITGGVKGIGRTVPRTSAQDGAVRQVTPGQPDGAIDLAVSPPGTPDSERGALSLTLGIGLQRQQGSRDWASIEFGVTDRSGPPTKGSRRGAPHAISWLTPNLLVFAGPAGLLLEMEVPDVPRPYQPYRSPPPQRTINVDQDDLLDVASDGENAMAVGRAGAAWRRIDGRWRRVPLDLPGATDEVTLTSVAYSAGQPIVASTAGVLTPEPGSGVLTLDPDLAALMREDGRPVSAEIVAGLPDGAAVVDGRYVRERPGQPWMRLDSPIEGDVVALSLWREPGAEPAPGASPTTDAADSTPASTSVATAAELRDLRIAASVADVRRATRGAVREVRMGSAKDDVYTYEQPPATTDGRLVVLGPDGWIDRLRTPMARSESDDLAARTPPIASVATDESGNGWVVGGSGSLDDLFMETTKEVPELFLAPLGTVPLDTRPADERSPEPRAARQATDVVASTPQPGPTSTSVPEQGTPQPDTDPTTNVRVLVGGHPACLSECAGRGDQGLAPDATLDDALVTAEKVAAPGEGSVPAVVVIGGGRATVRGGGLTRAGAQRYLDAFRAHPSVPVALAIGTGDAGSKASREIFAETARQLLSERLRAGSPLTAPKTPVAPIDRPGSAIVAYAIDAEAASGAKARIVVIDNAGGQLNDPDTQGRWLAETLDDARREERSTIVVGAARLDGAGGVQAEDRQAELSILGTGGADAYIATDGVDDPTDAFFGDQTVRYPAVRDFGEPIAMYRTAALGHQRRSGIFAGFDDDGASEQPDADIGWLSPAILDVTVGPGTRGVDTALLPVLSSIIAQEINYEVGSADAMVFLGLTRATTGMRIPASSEPSGVGLDPADVPEELNGTTPPGPATPSPESAANGKLVETRAPGWVYASPLPCRFFGDTESCRGQVPIDVIYDVADPSVAVFVRARPPSNQGGAPTIITDQNGDPVIDRTSPVLCPLRPGKTTMLIRVAGRTARYPLTVWPTGGRRPAGTEGRQAACAFRWISEPRAEEKPTGTTPQAAAPPVAAEPGGDPQTAPKPEPRAQVPVPRPLAPLVAAAPFRPYGMLSGAVPPVAPNPKPAAPGAPPAPPSGVTTQQAPAHQSSVQVQSSAVQQTVGVTAEERRTEVAREGGDLQASRLSHESAVAEARRQATAPQGAGAAGAQANASDALDASPTYRSSDAGPAVPLIAGGILAMLTALAGHAAGRQRRRRAAARRRSWLR